ncbi:MAG: hypothetical protein K0S70_5077 [Microbacterium sp.]|jgi:hypothetical protein|nr:hypothetical protein [Microbacterium sp. Kw_RZR3]MDF2047897.1 hypothetical protein [Microbacterium sp. Kw_RZR3]MDF2920859.1 hypothetical protein [Microbacterium sp.]
MTNHDGRADDAPDENSNGAGSESPDEGAAAQKDAEAAATTSDSPAGDIS